MSLIFLRCAASTGDEDDEGLDRGDDEKQQKQEEKEMVPFEGIAL